MRKNQVCGIVLVAIGLIALILVMQFKPRVIEGDPGPKLFPMIGILGILITGVLIFFQKSDDEKPIFSREQWMKIAGVFGIFIVYVFALKYLGYIPSTLAALFVITTLFAREQQVSLLKRAIFTVVVTFSIYFLFVKVLRVMLPSGLLF